MNQAKITIGYENIDATNKLSSVVSNVKKGILFYVIAVAILIYGSESQSILHVLLKPLRWTNCNIMRSKSTCERRFGGSTFRCIKWKYPDNILDNE